MTLLQVNSFKPTNKINIIDLDPKYQADANAITSSYAAEFDKDALVSIVSLKMFSPEICCCIPSAVSQMSPE